MIAATYVLQLQGPKATVESFPHSNWQIGPELLREVEENLSDLLPEGWTVKISAWDDEEGDSSE